MTARRLGLIMGIDVSCPGCGTSGGSLANVDRMKVQ